MGDSGVSQGAAADEPSEVVVKFDASGGTVRVPRAILVAEGKKMRTFKTWDKITETVKKSVLLSVGVSDPRLEALPRTRTVTLTCWGEYLPIGLGVPEDAEDNTVKFVQPEFVKRLFLDGDLLKRTEAGERVVSFKDLEEVVRRQDLRLILLKQWWKNCKVLLLVIVSEVNSRSGLLALRKDPMSVRFYEAETPEGLILNQIEVGLCWGSGSRGF